MLPEEVLSGVLTPNFLAELGIQLPESVAGDSALIQKFEAASTLLTHNVCWPALTGESPAGSRSTSQVV